MYVSLALLHAVSGCLAQRGVSPSELSGVGLGAALPQAPGMLPWADAVMRLERAAPLGADRGVALLLGEQVSARVLQGVGLAILNAKTVREGIAIFFRFAPLVIVGASFDLVEEGDHARFLFDPPPGPPLATRLVVEFGFSLLSKVSVDLLQREKRTRFLHLRHADPGHADAYRRVFGCDPKFGRCENAIGFAREVLDQPLSGGDDTLREVLFQRAEHALAAQRYATRFSVRVRALLREAELDKVDIRSVSKALTLSAPGLRRRLSAEDVTWSDLLDEARRERALEALARPETTIKELSDCLGFSEPSAFHRAFRRWTGMTPGAYRLSSLHPGSAMHLSA